jgi:Arc/MetJ family transcription regulator
VDQLLAEVVRVGRFKTREAAEEAALRAYLEHVFEQRRARGGHFLINAAL